MPQPPKKVDHLDQTVKVDTRGGTHPSSDRKRVEPDEYSQETEQRAYAGRKVLDVGA